MHTIRLAAALVTVLASSSLAAAECTPFGNAPRPYNAAMTQTAHTLVTCRGGDKLGGYSDTDGTARRACFYDNPAATSTAPLPLVVYLQASFALLDGQIARTGLIDARLSADLSGDPARPGYLLLAPLPRQSAHYYPLPNSYSLGFDVWYRQLAKEAQTIDGQRYEPNVDFATIDHFIAEQVAGGRVDAQRIYLVGYSNGASAALLYAQNRPEIAAAALYSAPNPYGFLDDPCQQQPVADAAQSDAELRVLRSDAPIFHVHRDCDIYGSCPNGRLLDLLFADSGTARLQSQIIDRDEAAVSQCDAACGSDPNGSTYNLKARLTGTANHNSWPTTWTAAMFDFLRGHPLPPPAGTTTAAP